MLECSRTLGTLRFCATCLLPTVLFVAWCVRCNEQISKNVLTWDLN
ncbi:MAG: hypothetical protein LBF72_02480 [Holosporales bacterium]|nr:hypothetical protein [Holosporales bacterium]